MLVCSRCKLQPNTHFGVRQAKPELPQNVIGQGAAAPLNPAVKKSATLKQHLKGALT